MPIRIVHVITGLNVGGAERMLLGLASAGRAAGLESTVICLAPAGPVSHLLEAQNVAVHHLDSKTVWSFPLQLRRLSVLIRDARPDLIQGWMYHGNLAALLASRKLGAPVVWNVRQSLRRLDLFKATTRLTIRANALLSSRVDGIIYNSHIARQQHEAAGFSRHIGTRIPNGVDLDRFSDQNAGRDVTRQRLGIADDELVVLSIGRVHPIKGHNILMQSMRGVINAVPKVRFLVVGRGASWGEEPFTDYQSESLLRDRAILMGQSSDVVELLSAADVFVSPSETEGFPNAVAEAMAAGLPCVVTDVGDCGLLVDDCGEIVAPGEPDSLVAGLLQMLLLESNERRAIGARARTRIQTDYSLRGVVQQYAQHYRRLVNCQTVTEGR